MGVEPFYPFVEPQGADADDVPQPTSPARIAVYDDMSIAPRVVTIEATDIRSYLEQITATVYDLAAKQGADWPFSLIRELVENYIHAYFEEPTVSILDKGQTLTFSDQGPGIADKQAALKPSFSSATKAMKRYIRGVGSGLPVVEEQIKLKHGTISIEDNIGRGTIVTVSLKGAEGHGEQPATGGQRPDQVTPAIPGAGQQQAYAPAQGVYAPPQVPIQTAQQPYAVQPGMMQYAPGQQPAQGWGYAQQPYMTGAPQGPQQVMPQQVYAQPMQQGNPWQPAYQPAYGQYGYPQQPIPQQSLAQPYDAYAAAQQHIPAQAAQQEAMSMAPYPGMVGGGAAVEATAQNQSSKEASAAGAAHQMLTSEQQRILLVFIDEDEVGPAELVEHAAASSPATASRRLKDLVAAGMIMKSGKKYRLTGEGAARLAALGEQWKGERR